MMWKSLYLYAKFKGILSLIAFCYFMIVNLFSFNLWRSERLKYKLVYYAIIYILHKFITNVIISLWVRNYGIIKDKRFQGSHIILWGKLWIWKLKVKKSLNLQESEWGIERENEGFQMKIGRPKMKEKQLLSLECVCQRICLVL